MTGDWSPWWAWLCCWMGSWRSNVWTDVHTVRRYLCVLPCSPGKNTGAVRTGRVIFRTFTPQCLLLLCNPTSGVFLWPFIYFRGLVLLWFLILSRHPLLKLWPRSPGGSAQTHPLNSEWGLLAHVKTFAWYLIIADYEFIYSHFLLSVSCWPVINITDTSKRQRFLIILTFSLIHTFSWSLFTFRCLVLALILLFLFADNKSRI